MRKTDRTTKHIETQKTIKRQNKKKQRKAANISKQMEHVKKTMSKDRRQQKHRCTMMREKIKNDQTQRKGSKSKNNKLQNKANLTTELKQQMDLNNANKHLSTNIASNTFKKIEKQIKHKQTHTHRTERNNTKNTHTQRAKN